MSRRFGGLSGFIKFSLQNQLSLRDFILIFCDFYGFILNLLRLCKTEIISN